MNSEVYQSVEDFLILFGSKLYKDDEMEAIKNIYMYYNNDFIDKNYNEEINTMTNEEYEKMSNMNWNEIIKSNLFDLTINKLTNEIILNFIKVNGFITNIKTILYSSIKRYGFYQHDYTQIVIGVFEFVSKEEKNSIYFLMDYDSNRCPSCGMIGNGDGSNLENNCNLYFNFSLKSLLQHSMIKNDFINLCYDIIHDKDRNQLTKVNKETRGIIYNYVKNNKDECI